jgi:hypothetical protein
MAQAARWYEHVPEGLPVPEVSPGAIRWRTRGTTVEVVVGVVNRGPDRTDPGHLVVEAAHLGAFVPGRVVARIAVPALDPGERRTVGFDLNRNALPSPAVLNEVILKVFSPILKARDVELLSTVDWAGNLNVWFDVAPERTVEVHRALNLKVAASRKVALGVFLPEEANGFDIATSCDAPQWSADVVRVAREICLLVVSAPGAGTRATVDLLVTRRADGRAVPVEFSFESINGPGECLGCVTV